VKTSKRQGVGTPSLVRSTLGVKGCVGALGWGLGKVTSKTITHMTYTNQTTIWLMRSWSTFGAQTSSALLKILSFAISHCATGMQLVVIYNYLGDVCNYKFGIV